MGIIKRLSMFIDKVIGYGVVTDDSGNPILSEGSEQIGEITLDPLGRQRTAATLSGRIVGIEQTLQNAVSATGNGTSIYMDGCDTFKITEISGTSTSRTIVFEISNSENGTYSAIQGVRLSDTSLGTQSTALNERWQFDGLAGFWFRARVSAIAGGNVTVKGKVVV